mmetsp:Transcript_37045/g.85535  ORF Transcript_37045/g.85535 Transcript_37045/m.85535 type:complete len:1105 (+) Transcript_37045:43-3357(+)
MMKAAMQHWAGALCKWPLLAVILSMQLCGGQVPIQDRFGAADSSAGGLTGKHFAWGGQLNGASASPAAEAGAAGSVPFSAWRGPTVVGATSSSSQSSFAPPATFGGLGQLPAIAQHQDAHQSGSAPGAASLFGNLNQATTLAAGSPVMNRFGGMDAGGPAGVLANAKAPSAPSGSAVVDMQQQLDSANELIRERKFAGAKAALAELAARRAGSNLVPEIIASADQLRWRMGLRQLSAQEVAAWLGVQADGGVNRNTPPQSQQPPNHQSTQPEEWAGIHASSGSHNVQRPAPATKDERSKQASALGAIAGTLMVAACISTIIAVAAFAANWSEPAEDVSDDAKPIVPDYAGTWRASLKSADADEEVTDLRSLWPAAMAARLSKATELDDEVAEEDAVTEEVARLAQEVAEAAVEEDAQDREQHDPELTILQESDLPLVPETFHPSQQQKPQYPAQMAHPASVDTESGCAASPLPGQMQLRKEWQGGAQEDMQEETREVETLQEDQNGVPMSRGEHMEVQEVSSSRPQQIGHVSCQIQGECAVEQEVIKKNDSSTERPAERHTLLLQELLADTVEDASWTNDPNGQEGEEATGILGPMDVLDENTVPLAGVAFAHKALAGQATAGPWATSWIELATTHEATEQTAEEFAQEFASNWSARPEVWFAGPSGPCSALHELEQPEPAKHQNRGQRAAPAPAFVQEATEVAESAQPSLSSAPSARRTWHGARPSASAKTETPAKPKPSVRKPLIEVESVSPALEDGFELARPMRFRPSGCIMRMDSGGDEVFLPVEHIRPPVEASTSAIRDHLRSLGTRVAVRPLEVGKISMYSAIEVDCRAQEFEARRRSMEAGIDKLRNGFDVKRWITGRVSTVQANGVYVGIVEGKDAFVPVSEMPTSMTKAMWADDKASLRQPAVSTGASVELRVIRYNWDNDSFVGSMLNFEESMAKRKAKVGTDDGARTSESRSASQQTYSYSQGSAAKDTVVEKLPELSSKTAERLAAKGFTIVNPSRAAELNAYVKRDLVEKGATSGRGGAAKVAKAADKQYIVNVARGMNTKVIGNVTVAKNVSEKEVKEAALELALKDGHLKAENENKGITISKNIITVKC